jgi:hypothetical protein
MWKTIIPDERFDFILEVSDKGFIILEGKLLVPYINNAHYPIVTLYTKMCKAHNFFIHRLLAQAFLNNGKPLGKLVVHHKDNDKTNFALSNLEILTYSQNIQKAYDDGFKKYCAGNNRYSEFNGMAKLSKENVIKIRDLIKTTKRTQKDIAKEFNISQSCVSRIINYCGWKRV